MLTEHERREIESEFPHYPDRKALSIDALKIVQAHRGWVSDEALGDVADLLGMTTAELEGVATFFNMIFRKPVGRHVIMMCDSVTCDALDGVALRQHLLDRLGIRPGQTTADGRFTMIPVPCLGVCQFAPVMMVDRDLHKNVTIETLDRVIDRLREET